METPYRPEPKQLIVAAMAVALAVASFFIPLSGIEEDPSVAATSTVILSQN